MTTYRGASPCRDRSRVAVAGRHGSRARRRVSLRPYLLASILGGLAACNDAPADDHRPIVAVSVPPQAFFVERIAGDAVRVEVMIPPGASPATYEPEVRQMKAIAAASLYVKVGHEKFAFEQAWLGRILADRADLRVVDCSAGLEGTRSDPHNWLAPPAVRGMVDSIGQALADLLPDQQKVFVERTRRFVEEIDRLDAEIRKVLAPYAGRPFFVFHPAWGAFAETYGLRQVAIEHEHKEPSYAHLRELMGEIKAAGARVVFIQPQFSRTSAELVSREVGAELVTINPLARDWTENLRQTARILAESFEK